jgi:CheY-like chemotaxis protein/HPt (histidine-containing phosphotransfer) domain-containing protein
VHETYHGLLTTAQAKGLDLFCTFAPKVPSRLRGDPARLQQILANLLDNAVKFTREGKVSLRVTLDHEDDSTAVIRFTVTDTGIGIPASKLGSIFDVFSMADTSTTRSHAGSGLGLAVARRLCELFGGRIGVESREARGSTFWCTIPLAWPVADHEPALPTRDELSDELPVPVPANGADADGAVTGAGTPRILVAEDDLVNQKVIVGTLSKMGYRADVVGNGREAVRAAAERRYDLVLMDIQMPEMDGLEATRQIRQQQAAAATPEIPVIAVTAYAVTEYRERCIAAGMDDFLTKPIHSQSLAEAISRWLTGAADQVPARLPQPAEAAFDRTALRERLGDDDALVQELIGIFLADIPDQIQLLEDAVLTGDTSLVRQHAHKLKGAAGSFGAPGLHASAIAIESAAKEHRTDQLPQLLETVKTEFGRLQQTLQR